MHQDSIHNQTCNQALVVTWIFTLQLKLVNTKRIYSLTLYPLQMNLLNSCKTYPNANDDVLNDVLLDLNERQCHFYSTSLFISLLLFFFISPPDFPNSSSISFLAYFYFYFFFFLFVFLFGTVFLLLVFFLFLLFVLLFLNAGCSTYRLFRIPIKQLILILLHTLVLSPLNTRIISN
ncbi:predicted protein [Lodderomyces elongisporus NRRL YB-4239]|uniref:Uncharacterized protein n=1 Tax=Lodderomyces elongisporus (strain ATCC 11503 / CBS 2605 / JCM 1781 / NBRC 1676 / NRRL YB-4239) TaxID=379508 RepID=A5E629_LODEL|nr:predicted protein [Lodderomyces elongisporus NRRL YB-4239]